MTQKDMTKTAIDKIVVDSAKHLLEIDNREDWYGCFGIGIMTQFTDMPKSKIRASLKRLIKKGVVYQKIGIETNNGLYRLK